jgi:regulator of sirC expression with transglutaminase-like and TPR domain
LFRLRGEDGDLEKAIACYEQAAGLEDVPPVVYRDLGLVHWKLGHEDPAREYLEVYLERAPQASDHEMIRAYLLELD